jgi:CRISPR/Cas system endoribonuclease Cas6 (RAMP superfamily)
MPTSSCSYKKIWLMKYSPSIHYLCRWSGHRTAATFLSTSIFQPCVTETDFCGGQQCHSSYTMLLSGICQTGCYASLGGYNRRLQNLYPPLQRCTSKNSTPCNFHYSHLAYVCFKIMWQTIWYFRVNRQKRYKEWFGPLEQSPEDRSSRRPCLACWTT